MGNEVLVEDKGYISVITLNRPDKLNAMNTELRIQLLRTLRDFNKDPKKRVAIITGSGRAFSAGADISSSTVEDVAEELRNSFYPILREIRFSNKIFISAAKGVVAGAGISLALAADIRYASKDTRFVIAFHNIGLAPDVGLALMMLRLGGSKFEKYILTGGEFNAEIARDLGFEVVDDPLTEAMKKAEEISNGPYKSYSASKRLINRVIYSDLEEFLDYESAMQGVLGKTYDFKEGIKAFAEKRKPQFRGE